MKVRLVLVIAAIAVLIAPALATTDIYDDKISINDRAVVTLIIGTSSDTKPTVGIPSGTMFLETDTGLVYMFNGTTWKAVGAAKLSQLTVDSDLDMGGYDILDTGNIMPKLDNVSSIGSPTARYNAIYVYGVYTGDLKFANGWILTEAEKLGLGHGIVLVSPDGSVYGVGNFKYLYNQYALVVAGVVIGVVMTAGAVVADRKLRK